MNDLSAYTPAEVSAFDLIREILLTGTAEQKISAGCALVKILDAGGQRAWETARAAKAAE